MGEKTLGFLSYCNSFLFYFWHLDKDLEMKYPRKFFYKYNKIAESKINSMHMTVPWSGNLCEKNYRIYGKSWCGKFKWAHSVAPPDMTYVKSVNKWWNWFHPGQHKVIIIEDWSEDSKMLGQYMKIWGDRYNFMAESKGGHINVEPGSFYIFITSNYRIDECFNVQDVDPILVQAFCWWLFK